MARRKPESEISSYAQLLFPTGWPHFLGAVMSMMLALGILAGLNSTLWLSEFDVGVRASVSLACVVVLTMTLVHPAFMLTRGKRWPRPFLRWYNIFCITFLVLAGLAHLIQGRPSQLYAVSIGLIFSFVAFWLYRSQGFNRFCEHYCLLWDNYRLTQRSGR